MMMNLSNSASYFPWPTTIHFLYSQLPLSSSSAHLYIHGIPPEMIDLFPDDDDDDSFLCRCLLNKTSLFVVHTHNTLKINRQHMISGVKCIETETEIEGHIRASYKKLYSQVNLLIKAHPISNDGEWQDPHLFTFAKKALSTEEELINK